MPNRVRQSVREMFYLLLVFLHMLTKFSNLLEMLMKVRIPVIVITDSILSPLGLFSDVCLEVKETEVFGFRGVVLGALMCLALSLVVELGRQIEQQKKEVK